MVHLGRSCYDFRLKGLGCSSAEGQGSIGLWRLFRVLWGPDNSWNSFLFFFFGGGGGGGGIYYTILVIRNRYTETPKSYSNY